MRSHPLYTCLSISSIFSLSNAWPLILGHHERREPASYSVVAVDGGSSGGDGSATTVTNSVIHTETVLKTQLSTIVITESDTPSTIVVTITSASPATVTEQTAPSISTQTITSPPQTTAEPSQPQGSSPPAPETVTVTQPLPSSKAYDDGMWHTHYYYTVSDETTTRSSLPSSTLEAADALPSTTRGSNWWGGPSPETVSTSLEPTYTSTTSTSTSADWASLWLVPVSDSPSVTTSSSSVAAPTIGIPFWGRPPNSATTSTS